MKALVGRNVLNTKIWYIVGALLSGIGGTYTRMGFVYVLFVTEFIGLLLIYTRYIIIRNDKSSLVHANQTVNSNPFIASPYR
jgi:hypothetical protein